MPTANLQARMGEWDQAAWSLAALALVLDPEAASPLRGAAERLLEALGIHSAGNAVPGFSSPAQAAAQARSPLIQGAMLFTTESASWADRPASVLLAQGQASAQGARAFAQLALPSLDGLAERLAAPGAQMLDVGVGVAAMAVAFCEVFPALTVTGIDTAAPALRLAEQTVAASAAADRVVLRRQDLGDLTDEHAYDLAWLPAPFIPSAALSRGAERVARALKPGGWLLLAHGRFTGDPVEDALSRFKTAAYGGTALNGEDARALVTGAGFRSVRSLPTPAGAPAITVGRI